MKLILALMTLSNGRKKLKYSYKGSRQVFERGIEILGKFSMKLVKKASKSDENGQRYDNLKAPRAAKMGPAGRMRPAGRTLATPGLMHKPFSYNRF